MDVCVCVAGGFAWHVCAPLIHRLTKFNEARSQSGYVSVARSTFQRKNVKTC